MESDIRNITQPHLSVRWASITLPMSYGISQRRERDKRKKVQHISRSEGSVCFL